MKFLYFRGLYKNLKTKYSMTKIAKLLFFATLTLLLTEATNAQKKLIAKADQEFADGGYVLAAKDYQLALPGVKDLNEKGRIIYHVAESYRLSLNYNNAYEWYDKAITAQYYKTNPEVYYNYALALAENEKWEEAQAQLNKYIEKGGDKTKANNKMAVCKAAAEKKAGKASRILVENVAELNTQFFDYGLYPMFNKGGMLLTSSRQSAMGVVEDPKTGESFMDLFTTERDKKMKFSVPQPIPGGVNSTSNEGSAIMDKEGDMMLLTWCKYVDEERFACDIAVSKRTGKGGWGAPVAMNLVDRSKDDSAMVGHPCFTPDEKFLLFSSDMAGGKGGKDLWYVTYDKKTERWGTPVNLSSINTKGDEKFPYVAEDGTLYFSSDGYPGGLGGQDIFKAEKTGDLSYGNPSAMPFPINSSSDDVCIIIDKTAYPESKFAGYFSSNRPGGKGKVDIYSFREPPLEFELIATVYDNDNGSPIADADVTVVGSNGDNFQLKSDGNGGVSLGKDKMKGDVTYAIEVAKKDYIGTADKLTTKGLKESTTFAKEYFIKPIILNTIYELPEVRYDYNKATLQVNNEVNSKDSLNYLYDLLVKNPGLVIELAAHTDPRGDDAYNLKLSQGRAESCVEYLVKEKGINALRIKAVGKGETEPKVTNKEYPGIPKGSVLTDAFINALKDEKAKEIAWQLDRRTEFKIIATDFKN